MEGAASARTAHSSAVVLHIVLNGSNIMAFVSARGLRTTWLVGLATSSLILFGTAMSIGDRTDLDSPTPVDLSDESMNGVAQSSLPFATFSSRAPSAHPTLEDLEALMESAGPRGGTPPTLAPDDPPDSPLASGSFINFESPPVKPITLSDDATRLFVANTPNNRLEIIDTTAPRLAKLYDVPVGLDPVAVAVQPETNSNIVWVANMVSDNVSIVDVAAGKVIAMVEVGDEPVNILFNPAGTFAFVVVQGAPAVPDPLATPTDNVQEGALVVVSGVAPYSIVRSRFLDMNTPRAAVYDPQTDRVIVAALHSGNNTTVVGNPVIGKFPAPPGACCLSGGSCTDANEFECWEQGGVWLGIGTACATAACPADVVPAIDPPPDPCGCQCSCIAFPNLLALQLFTATFSPTPAEVFADGGLSPFPDIWTANPTGPAGPIVQRIVRDAGANAGDWKELIDLITDDSGAPDPQRVADFEAQFGAINGAEIFQHLIDDAKNTIDRDLIVIDASNPTAPGGLAILEPLTVPRVGTTLTGLARNPATTDLFVSNLQPKNLTRLEPELNGNFMDHEVVIVKNVQTGGVIEHHNIHLLPNPPGGPIGGGAGDLTPQQASLANPMDIVFRPDGSRAYLAAFGVGRIGILNGQNASVISRVDVGRGPRGLALDAAQNRLYVLNRTDLSISVVDVTNEASPFIRQTFNLFNPEPPEITAGRDFLYSTRHSADFSSSCALCHIDGNLDHVAWDLGAPDAPAMLHTPFIGGIPCPPQGPAANHPLKGPMVTLSLKGLRNHTELHWRGDRVDFNDFNGAFENLLGGSQLSEEDMQAYTDFMLTVVYPPNDYRTRDNQFKNPAADPGRALYVNACDRCHMLSHDGKMQLDCIPDGDDGAFNLSGLFAQIQLVPQMRVLHRKFNSDKFNGFGLLHDGREEREANDHPIDTFLQQFFPGIAGPVPSSQMIAFLTAFQTNVMPVVGWQVDWNDAADGTKDLADINTMIAQHALAPSRCDVVVQGMVAGEPRGWVLVQPSPPVFRADDDTLVSLDDLAQIVANGQPLVVTAVPPGSGTRIGIDQDLDGLPNGLDPHPQWDSDGDVNLDGKIDGADMQPFVNVLFAPANPASMPFQAADITNDGLVDFADVGPLVDLLVPQAE